MELVLASGSPRRRELLTRMGLSFRVAASEVSEGIDRDMPPEDQVYFLSRRKAAAAAAREGEDVLILAADTMVALEGEVMGKPRSEAEAARMLAALSGRTHEVYTGFTLRQGSRVDTQVERTLVTFRALTDAEIAAYIATGEPMDKAGAYGIQGRGALLVSGIQGDYCNVMGLPVCRLGLALRQFGLDPLLKGGPM